MAEPVLGKVRIIDIAQRVGVSKATVARVLNHAGKNSIRVSEARKQQILEVAREMHYVPNHAAQTLAGKSNMRIGLLIDRGARCCTQRIAHTIAELAENAGYQVIVGQSHDNPESLYHCYETFQLHGVDGIICLAHEYPGQEDIVRSCFQTAENIVYLVSPTWDAPFVANDSSLGMAQAMEHLQAIGRRRIAFWMPGTYKCTSCRVRTATYRAHNTGADLIFPVSTSQEAYQLFLAHKPDAMLADSDIMAAQLMRELLSHGISVPDDVAIIGNNNENFTSCIYPSLSTIDHHEQLLGEQLFQLLMETTGKRQPTTHALVPTSLIIRESSQPRR